jgi:alkanesulfonate monooxygenase SsuD/methylene tetrahydromethanopterin reductase-like flavin-dependent oxidoreductase (luciferase family)
MRFGHFFYPMNFDPARDAQVIHDCLAEATLVEQLGLDAIWVAEHHFTGETVYGDALVFAAALAVKTHRILLGLGVVEMALHNPVQLAIQTALLDNLSRGRLIVGTGRGSNYNAYEYRGFGTDILEGQKRLPEAEDLLIKAWTTEALEYHGAYWQVTVPAVRPRPYQQPHPPLARACLSEESIRAMARLGRPVLLRGRAVTQVGASIRLYAEAMRAAGFTAAQVAQALDQSWVWYEAHVAPTDAQALDEFLPPFAQASQAIAALRERWNPKDLALPRPPPPLPRAAYGPTPNPEANEALVGSPRRVAAYLALLQAQGVRNLMLTNRGLLAPAQTQASLRLLSAEVMPQFREEARASYPSVHTEPA